MTPLNIMKVASMTIETITGLGVIMNKFPKQKVTETFEPNDKINIKEVRDWLAAGDREVEIHFKSHRFLGSFIWFYDYKTIKGGIVYSSTDLPKG